MATTTRIDNAPLVVAETDFDLIRSSLVSYMKNQDEFANFNYEGAGITQIINALAYNTHHNAWYINFLFTESRLGSAQLRSSVVGLAKDRGYLPKSWISPYAIVTVDFGVVDPGITFIARNEIFQAGSGSNIVRFVTLETWPIEYKTSGPLTGHYVAENVKIYEGRIRSQSFVFNASAGNILFNLKDQQIDTTSIKIRVQNSQSDLTGFGDAWLRADDITDIDSESKVYFIQESTSGSYDVYFGDGILGKALANGNVIRIDYLVTNGPLTNGLGSLDSESARTFEYPAFTNSIVIVGSPAYGGSVQESIESIKFNLPRQARTQNRSVLDADYEATIASMYPGISSIYAWGGETETPPRYGEVLIAVKPSNGITLSADEKSRIERDLIEKQSVVGITPVLQDADFVYLLIESDVYFDTKKTTISANTLKTIVSQGIASYSATTLEKFGNDFRYSRLTRDIDDTSNSIVSNETTVKIQKRISPEANVADNYELDFNNPILKNREYSISTSPFKIVNSKGKLVDAYLRDEPSTSKIVLAYLDTNGSEVIQNSSAGEISYENGTITLTNFKPYSYTGTELRITAVPKNKDIYASRNKILIIDNFDTIGESIKVTVYDANLFT